jgi:hypothetical protein
MGKRNTGPHNPNWRGGRSIASNGYVLIRVGEGHPDADVRGYAYEHKLVAQKKLGRKLRKGEQVHHKDHNKQNNHPDNLEVAASLAHHRVMHRKEGSKNRMPGEDNPLIACMCGCGATFIKYDSCGRPREYVSGHNQQPEAPTQNQIIEFIRSGIKSRKEMLEHSERSKQAIAVALSRMKREGTIVSVGHGVYDLPPDLNIREFPEEKA